MTDRVRRFGWKAFLLAAVVVAMVWLVVAQRARIVESLGLLAHADWWWVGAAVVAQAVSMGAMARQQRRLLGVGGSRISLAGVVATTYAGNAISVGLPLAGPAAATVFAMRDDQPHHRHDDGGQQECLPPEPTQATAVLPVAHAAPSLTVQMVHAEGRSCSVAP